MNENYIHGRQQRYVQHVQVGVEEDRHPQWVSVIGVRQMKTTSGDVELLFIPSANKQQRMMHTFIYFTVIKHFARYTANMATSR